MSLARDVGRALGITKSHAPRAKKLPKRVPKSFGDELLAREYEQAVERHTAAIRELRAARSMRSRELVAQCRERVAATRAAAWESYRSAQEAARARRRGEVAQAAAKCRAGRVDQLAPIQSQIAAEQAALDERRRERRAFLRRERSGAAAERRRARSAPEAAAEERGAVRYALEQESPELVPLWDRVGRTIKAGPRRTLREAFLDWAQEHPEDVEHARSELAERQAREAREEWEAHQREAEAATMRQRSEARAAEAAAATQAARKAQRQAAEARFAEAVRAEEEEHRGRAPAVTARRDATPSEAAQLADLVDLLDQAEEPRRSAADRERAHAEAMELAPRLLHRWRWSDHWPSLRTTAQVVPSPAHFVEVLARMVRARGVGGHWKLDELDGDLLREGVELGLLERLPGYVVGLTKRGTYAADPGRVETLLRWLDRNTRQRRELRRRAERQLARNLAGNALKVIRAHDRKKRREQAAAEVPF